MQKVDGAQAKFYFQTSNSTLAPGSEFNIPVYLDTDTKANALDIEISYPKDKIKFLDSSNARSIVDLWQVKPKMLPNGNIGFSGGMIQGFAGTKGLIITLSFRALSAGDANLSFVKKDLYLADGKGTKMSPSTSPLTLSVKEGEKVVVIEESHGDKTPPDLTLTVIKNNGENNTLLVFNATDPESGIKLTEARFKKWFSYGEWVEVQNPILYSRDIWQAELRTQNNEGAINIKFVSTPMRLAYKLLLILISVIFIVYVAKWVYNKVKPPRIKQYEA